jgi:hypothetical protein
VVDPQSTAAMLDAMAHLIYDISMSLDSFVSGPELRSAEPLGTGGELLHAWMEGRYVVRVRSHPRR